MADDDKKTGYQVEFTQQAFSRLEEIREKVGAKNNAEVVMAALCLYDWLLDQQKAGAHILLQKAGEYTVSEVELLVPLP